jgi:hypothetical protein
MVHKLRERGLISKFSSEVEQTSKQYLLGLKCSQIEKKVKSCPERQCCYLLFRFVFKIFTAMYKLSWPIGMVSGFARGSDMEQIPMRKTTVTSSLNDISTDQLGNRVRMTGRRYCTRNNTAGFPDIKTT